MPRTLKIPVPQDAKAGGEIDFALPDDFLHKDDIKESYLPKDHFEGELKRRVDSVTKGMHKKEDLLKDEEFLKEVAQSNRDKLIPLMGIDPKGNLPDLEKLTNEVTERVTKTHVDPLKVQVSQLGEENNALRLRSLSAQVYSAGSRPDSRIVPDLLELVEIHVRGKAGWDQERKEWFIKNAAGDGFELSSNPKKGGHPYKTVDEFISDLAREEGKKAWFEAPGQPGAGYSGSGGGANVTTLEQYNKLKPAEKTAFAQQHPEEFTRIMGEIAAAGEKTLFRR